MKCRVRYDHVLDGKTRAYFDSKTEGYKHINVMLRRYPYAVMHLETPTRKGGWKPDSSYEMRNGKIVKR